LAIADLHWDSSMSRNELTEYETERLAMRLKSGFIERKRALRDDRRLTHQYQHRLYLETFKAAVNSHHLFQFGQILDGAFRVLADPQPEDLVGDEAMERTRLGRRDPDTEPDSLLEDPCVMAHQLDKEIEALRAGRTAAEYRGHAILRFVAIRLMGIGAFPAETVLTAARDAILENKVDRNATSRLEAALGGERVFIALNDAAAFVADYEDG
jgi:hypothetical protein